MASVHETPGSRSSLSTRRTCHLEPFHDMAKLPTSARCPTAMQLTELMQETPFTKSVSGGVPSGVQLLPFHDSACVPPVAMQLVPLAQEMAVGPPGGAGSTAHVVPFQDSARLA